MTVSAFLLVCLFLLITQFIVTSRAGHAKAVKNRVASPVDPLSLLEGEDKIWADNMLLKAGIIEEPKPEPKHLVLDDDIRIDPWTNTVILSQSYLEKYNHDLECAKRARQGLKSVDSRKIDEFKAKVEARSMVTLHEKHQATIARKPKPNPHVRYDHETQSYQLDTGQRITKDVFEDLAIHARMDLKDIYAIYTGESHIPIKYYGIPAAVFR